MPRKRFREEEIIHKLREVLVLQVPVQCATLQPEHDAVHRTFDSVTLKVQACWKQFG
ncbi:MAG: hypothetical protein KDA75_07725 [Planctomycetaceae bacterium]|nr:hypothetical protein [Planctomycetaceae bacterium]